VREKQVVRRRRALLALLVAASLILLTAYFGESPSSPLHRIQRGIVEVVSPIQQGASRVLSPVRDVAGWVSSTLHAKARNQQLLRDNRYLQDRLALAQQQVLEYRQAARNVALDVKLGINSSQRVDAAVIAQDPSQWYQTIVVNRGSDDGVQVNDPVVGDGALVGKVTDVGATFAVVTLITDHSYQVAAEVQDGAGDRGSLLARVGNPGQLLLQYLPSHAPVQPGDEVVTAGFSDPSNPRIHSIFPAGIPIGQVSNFNPDQLLNNDEVPVTPTADLLHLENVQILISGGGGTRLAAVGHGGGGPTG